MPDNESQPRTEERAMSADAENAKLRKDEAEARRKITDMHPDVVDDETGGEVVDVQILKLRSTQ